MATLCQDVFCIEMLFNLTSVVDWQVEIAVNQCQVDIGNFRGNSRWVTHDYTIVDLVYVEMTGIYRKLDYLKRDHIESLKYLQTVQFDSNGDK